MFSFHELFNLLSKCKSTFVHSYAFTKKRVSISYTLFRTTWSAINKHEVSDDLPADRERFWIYCGKKNDEKRARYCCDSKMFQLDSIYRSYRAMTRQTQLIPRRAYTFHAACFVQTFYDRWCIMITPLRRNAPRNAGIYREMKMNQRRASVTSLFLAR